MSSRTLVLLACAALAGCTYLPDFPTPLCGNHVLEPPGEDCDSLDPDCGDPGGPAACHLRCGAGLPACPYQSEICDPGTGYCRVPPQLCGNGVVEPGEDCDANEPGCGPPDAGVHACRHLCTSAHDCPSGSTCGSDGICRFATGTYRLGPLVPATGVRVGVLDVNGDNSPDLLVRGPAHATFYQNDGTGTLRPTPLADGVMEGFPLNEHRADAHVLRLARVATGPNALWAAATSNGVQLFTRNLTGQLISVGPTSWASQNPSSSALTFLGASRRAPGWPPDLTVLDWQHAQLTTYWMPPDSWLGPSLFYVSSFDLSTCGVSPRADAGSEGRDYAFEAARGLDGDASVVLIRVSLVEFCALTTDAGGGWHAQRLELPDTDNQTPWQPSFGDLDGDGKKEAVFLLGTSTDQSGELLVFEKTLNGFANGRILPIIGPADLYDSPVFADFDHDGLDDFIANGVVGKNTRGSFTMLRADPKVTALAPASTVATDVNDDGNLDVAFSRVNSLNVCLGDGTGVRFSCVYYATPWNPYRRSFVADANGDGIADIVVTVPQQPERSPIDQSGLLVFLGRRGAWPETTPLTLDLYRDRLADAAPAPSLTGIGDDLFALAQPRGDSDALGLAVARAAPRATSAFSWPFSDVRDLRALDVDGDGAIDLALLEDHGITILYGIESGATPLRSETIHNGQAPGIQFATLGDDPLLLVGWSPIEIWIGRRNGQQTEQLVSGDESEFHGGAFSDPGLAPTVVNRDLDGDGRPELLAVFYTRTNTTTPICAIWVARADSDGVKLTRAGSGDFMCANGAAALVDAPPLDGRLDMLFFDGASHLLLARQLADGTFQFPKLPDGGGAAEPAPALFDDGTGVRQWDPSWTWIDTVDMNGDGIPDVVFSAPEGVYVALAEVKLR